MGKYQQNIENARRVGVIDFLQTCRPGELIRVTDKEYRTKTHSSLVISSNGLFHWFSMGVGGNNAIDYLTKVENMDFVSAVRLLNEVAIFPVSFQPAQQSARIPEKKREPLPFQLPAPDRNADAVAAYLQNRGISPSPAVRRTPPTLPFDWIWSCSHAVGHHLCQSHHGSVVRTEL